MNGVFMKVLKKVSFWMTAVCAAAVMPVPCHAEETYSYTKLDDGTISLYCENKSIMHADIPSELDGYTVSHLAEGCFSDCSWLETVTIPDTVTSIQSYAFQNCIMLEEITIPEGVRMVDDFVFEGCLSLTDIFVEEGNTTYYDTDGVLFKNASSATLMRYPAAKEAGGYTIPTGCDTLAPWSFTDCKYLRNVRLSDVKAIGADAFMGCERLKNVEMSNHITELIGASFANCSELKSVTLPSKLESIGDRCFYGCVSLHEINIPDTLVSIGEMAFFGCVELEEMNLPPSLKTIGKYGIGYSVDDDGEPVVISELKLEVPFGSKSYRYAKDNGLNFHSEAPQNLMITLMIIIFMTVLFFIGFAVESERKKKEMLAEEARRQKRLRTEQNAEKRKKRR